MIAERRKEVGSGLRERRDSSRTKASRVISVNSGRPYRGGALRDISTSGIAVDYPAGTQAEDKPVEIGEMVKLILGGVSTFSGRVTRTFEGGFAIRFNWQLDIRKAFC